MRALVAASVSLDGFTRVLEKQRSKGAKWAGKGDSVKDRERERERVSSPSLKIFPPKEKEKTEEPGGGGGREGNGKRDEKHAPPSGEHD